VDQKLVYRTNQRAISVFILILMLFIIMIDYFVLSQHYTELQENVQQQAAEKVRLSGQFVHESILKDDWVSVEQFLLAWAKSEKNVIALQAFSPNGFSLVDYKKPSKANNTITVSENIKHLNKTLLKITLIEDISNINNTITASASKLILISLFVVSLLGYVLWRLLRRTAIIPLQQTIADQAVTQKALIERTKELELSNQELESYSYSIAHDLRTPLRSITSFSQILKEDARDKLNFEEKDYLDRVIKAGSSMSELIFDILELSKISRDKMKINYVDLSKVASEIIIYLKNTWPDKKFDITIQKDIYVRASESALRILMDNLLSNACKYSSQKKNPKVEFGIHNINNEIPVFYIKDNGIGFDMAYSEKIFLPFQRLHNKDEYEGSGIGMATAKRIVEKHHGNIWVESDEEKGTIFYFTLGRQNLLQNIA